MRLFRYLMIGVIVIIITGMMVSPVNAIPPLPSSLFGTVHLNGEKVPEGTSIRALIDGVVMGEGQTMIYQGESVYSLDIKGDDPDTKEIDGGVEGDIIHFNVGGVIAEETGVWQGGTNVELNLSVITSDPIATPKPTDNPLPTQTEIGNRSENPEAEQNSLLTPDPTPEPTITSDFNEVEVASLTEVSEADQKSTITEEVQPLPAIEDGATLASGVVDEGGNESREEGSEDHPSWKPLAIIGLVVVIVGSITGIILRKHIGH
jgi:hypothetical protein